jgi:cytochrome c oxidase cbb3-type subunit 3
MKLYREKSCGSCHKLGGRGGTLGPALDREGAKTKHQLIMSALKPPHTTWNWQLTHFRDPGGVVPDSQMRNPTVTQHEAQALTAFMLSQWKRDVPESYLAPDKIEQKYLALHPTPLTGEQVYQQYCGACHGNGTYTRWDQQFGRFVPAIRGISLATTATQDYLRANLENGRPGTQMPAWGPRAGGLMPEEIAAVIDYLRNGSKPAPSPTILTMHGDDKRGLTLYLRNCEGCHGMSGRGGIAPEIGNPTFQTAASDDLILRTIRYGRVGTPMPAFQRADGAVFSDQDLADILAYVRSLRQPSGQRTVAKNAAPIASGGEKQ